MATPEKQQNYRLANADGFGIGGGALPAGSLVEVEDVYPADTPGVGSEGTDVVVVLFEGRRISLPVDTFGEIFTLEEVTN